jgi:murein DD-endopeptidase MepM/ murein hydrolase activator NlpD
VRFRRTAIAAAFVALTAPVLAAPAGPALADSTDDAKRRVAVAAGELESSNAAVQRAAVSLAAVAAELPAARHDVATARGELAGARARLAEASTRVRRAELATAAAQRRVDAANAKVQKGRDTVGLLARRSYQQGPLGDLRDILSKGTPQEIVDRAETLKVVFRSQNDVLHALSVDRLHLATEKAGLGAQQQVLEQARGKAVAGEQKARDVAVRADKAAARVAALVAQRGSALAEAEANRAADVAEYRAANAASRQLAARLRALALERARAAARNNAVVPTVGTGRFLWPSNGPLTSRFGYRQHPIFAERRFHAGIDLGSGYGAPVWSAAPGTVVFAGAASGYGTLVVVSHGTVDGTDLSTAYAHMSAVLVSEGQQVARGQQVGRVGNEGNSTGPHLHFEVRRNGEPVDPLDWVSP